MEVVKKVDDVTSLEDSVHWFCPRLGDQDGDIYFDEDLSISDPEHLTNESKDARAARQKRCEEAVKRTELVLDACTILAFDGDDARPFQDKLKHGLSRQLVRCDVCVREYHRARSKLQGTLEGVYGTDEVQSFMETFDAMNKSRITKGLDTAREMLLNLAPEQRNIASAGEEGMYAMFEALNCIPLLEDEPTLVDYFDRPFELVQTKKKVKLPSYSPGMISFLYSNNSIRSTWAHRNYTTLSRNVVPGEFDNSIRPFFERALNRVHISCLDDRFLPYFWRGTATLLAKLDNELLTSKLRALDSNLWTMGLEHFQLDLGHFDDLLQSYTTLLKTGPRVFWDAMGAINPQAVLDTIFKAPRLEKAMKMTDEAQAHLDQKFAWVDPFIGSIQANNLVPPVRTIVDQLLKKYQDKSYPKHAQRLAFELGLRALLKALRILKDQNSRSTIVSGLLEFIAKEHMPTIVMEVDGVERKDEMRISKTQEICLQAIELMLALDCRSLAGDRTTILQTRGIDYQPTVSELKIWLMSLRGVRPGHPTLAGAIVAGMQDLLGVEPLSPRQIEVCKKQAEQWNSSLQRIYQYTKTDLLERLQSFSPEQLLELFQDQHATPGLFALLFSGEQQIHQATLDVFKTISGEDSRRDAIMYVAKQHFRTTCNGVVGALRVIARSRSFAPCANMIKLATDLYDCLCNDSDGILRSGRTYDKSDLGALENLWQFSWISLSIIFEQTEAWSNLGYDKALMQDFCRFTMDFAELIFDQYSLIANVIQAASATSLEDVQKRLLERPKGIFTNVTKWLRLRDDYLIIKAVRLTCKMLLRLEEAGIQISKEAAASVEGVLIGKIKTKLSANQKAECQRALENHFGELLTGTTANPAPSTLKQSSLQGWSSSGQDSGRSTPVDRKPARPGVIDVDAWSAAAKKNNEATKDLKQMLDKATPHHTAFQKQQELAKKQTLAKPTKPSRAEEEERKKAEFKRKRQQDRQASERQRLAAIDKLNDVSAGSGVLGLGDLGKDHARKGENVMVSSDEESESDADDFDEGLWGPRTKKERKPRVTDVDPRGAIGLKPEQKRGPTRIQRTQRSQKDMRARLKPNLSPLHRIILKWDFFHDGDYPPGSSDHQFQAVSDSFQDPVSYKNTFEPLLTLEAWQGMVRAREESAPKSYEIKVQGRSNVDGFLEISSSVSQAENRELQLQEGDIVLLSQSKHPMTASGSAHCLARINRVKRQKAHLETLYQLMPGGALDRNLTLQSAVYGVKVQSIVPLEREFGSLVALQFYDLCNQIVRARPSNKFDVTDKVLNTYQDNWNVNRAQAEAINAALVNEGFTLIQGPPGSGKTKTIVAIVGGLLSDQLGKPKVGTKINMPGQVNTQASSDTSAKKLLVCAPSNAAVDELVMRLKDGVKTRYGREHKINVVRIGRSDAINTQVLDVTMDELVSKRLGPSDHDQATRAKAQEVFREHEKVSAELRELNERRDTGQVKGKEASELQDQIVAVRKRKHDLGQQIDNVKDQERNAGRDAELNRKRAQQAVLDQADVICATLSGSGHDMFRDLSIDFETVIIDEAAQCVEMSSLIPLKYNCIRCVMVGDPKQLPPTVFSKEAARFQYEQSLFVRMQNNHPGEVHLLDTQYRMHPDISIFPSRTFYDGMLKDGKGMAGLRQRPWHASELLAPYRFFDVQGQQQASTKGNSLTNEAEIRVARALYIRLRTDFLDYDFKGKIGIITPYKAQLRKLKQDFLEEFGNGITDIIEFNTTDAFQGRESEIIIFSCVRASPAGGIGFLQDIRRMNVGLTRAKSSLWVLGNSDSLVRGRYWKMLVDDAQSRDSYSTGDILGMLKKRSSEYRASGKRDESMYDVSSHQQQLSKPSKAKEVPVRDQQSIGALERPKDDSRMEGVTYRFEDRIKQKRPAPEGEQHRPGRPRVGELDGDVEMGEASDTGTATPITFDGHQSRDSTPQVVAGGAPARANGPTAQQTSSNVAPQRIIRRGGTDPFIRPRKR